MKNKLICLFVFVLINNSLFGQSYTTLTEDGIEIEYVSITEEQFNRILRSHEQSATSVFLDFYDVAQSNTDRVIRGTRPQFNGISYWLIRTNPQNSNEMAWIRYRNGNKCILDISFYDILFEDTISLKYDRNEYIRRYNIFVNMIRNAR